MAFLPNIPQPNDDLSKSQGDILNNFVILGAIAGNSNPASAAINAAAGFNWLFLPTQGAIPPAGAAFPANTVGLYSAVNASSGGVELYINKTITGPGLIQIPMTASASRTAAGVNFGWAYLPSGLKVIWGQSTATAPATSNTNVVFNNNGQSGVSTFPGFSTFVGAIVLTRLGNGVVSATANFPVLQSNYTLTGFSWYPSATPITGTVSITYYAIGL